MFIVNLKMSRIKKGLLIFCAVVTVLFGISLLTGDDAVYTESISASSRIKAYSASTNEERIKFLSSYGWETGTEALEIAEVIIPSEFDETYQRYNEIQKAQSLDLEKYKGKRVKRYTYEVTNYPGEIANIRANLLVYNGMIVGGDVCSVELGGFMHGFQKT